MSGYEKVSLLKFEAAGQSWLIAINCGRTSPSVQIALWLWSRS